MRSNQVDRGEIQSRSLAENKPVWSIDEPAWRIQVLHGAEKPLKKLDKPQVHGFRNALVRLPNWTIPPPRVRPISGSLTGLWRYRGGDKRIILGIRRPEVVIATVDL